MSAWIGSVEVWVFMIGGLLLGGLLLELAYGVYRHGIGPTPSTRVARAAIAQLCREELIKRASDRDRYGPLTIHELGSGWGGLSFKMTRELSSISSVSPEPLSVPLQMVGYEISFTPYLISELSALLLRYSVRVGVLHTRIIPEFRRGDLIDSLREVQAGDLCICYLCPAQMVRISEYLREKRSSPAFTLISLTFALPHFTPIARYILPTLYRDTIYMYQISDGQKETFSEPLR